MNAKGILYLIPTVLAEGTSESVISPQIKEVIKNTEYYLSENIRTSRRFISSLNLGLDISMLHFEKLDKNTGEREFDTLLKPIFSGKDIGIMSEAGCPGIADPGALAVAYAHRNGVQVVPLSGPSSFFLALMASGFNGQSFAFHGYLPIEKKARTQAIRHLETESQKQGRTQIFMETPFRNNQLFADLCQNLSPHTLLCVAKNITAKDEWIKTKSILDWKKTKVDLHKIPTVFLIHTGNKI